MENREDWLPDYALLPNFRKMREAAGGRPDHYEQCRSIVSVASHVKRKAEIFSRIFKIFSRTEKKFFEGIDC